MRTSFLKAFEQVIPLIVTVPLIQNILTPRNNSISWLFHEHSIKSHFGYFGIVSGLCWRDAVASQLANYVSAQIS